MQTVNPDCVAKYVCSLIFPWESKQEARKIKRLASQAVGP